jgi:hypothetical protein
MEPTPRLIRWLKRLYPREYRDRFGAEMEAFFRRERAAGAGGALYWARLVADHVRASTAVRLSKEGRSARRLWDDLTAGFRSLRRAPTFAFFAVLTLGLGIGATTAVFGVLDRVVLRPLPLRGWK